MNHNKKAVCTIVLVAVNIIVFLALSFMGVTEDANFMLNHGAMYTPYVMEKQEYYRLFTSMFLHFDINHLLNNMLMLAVLGWILELEIGRIKFLLIYFIGGLGGSALSLGLSVRTGDYAVSAGASGAICAMAGALIYVAIRNHGHIGRVSGRGLILMVALIIYFGVTSTGTDNAAHIGGVAAGLFLSVLLYHDRKDRVSGFSAGDR